MVAQHCFVRGVFSRDVAPYLPGLSDVVPEVLTISFPRGYNPLPAKLAGITPKSSPEGLHDFGMTEVENPYGNTVRAYDTEHMLCDPLGGTVSLNLQLLLLSSNPDW